MGFSLSDLDPTKHVKDFIKSGGTALGAVESIFNEVGRFIEGPKAKSYPVESHVPGSDIDLGSTRVSKSSNIEKIPVIYGLRRVEGTIVFITVNGNNNNYLNVVYVLCEGPIHSIPNVYINDIISTDAIYTNKFNAYKFLGESDQAANSNLYAGSPGAWTSNHRLRGLAYVTCRFVYDSEVYRSIPKVTFDVMGKKVYDPRTTLTTYSSNPVLALRDYLTNPIYGKGLSSNEIDDTAVGVAATYCETQMASYTGGPNISYYDCNIVLETENTIIDNVNIILSSFRGMLPYYGGKYVPRIEKDESSTFTFNEDNIVSGSWNFSGTSKKTKLNSIKSTFVNYENNWQPDLVTLSVSEYLTADSSIKLEKTLSLPFEIVSYRAKWHQETTIKKSREAIIVGFVATIAALKVETGDIVGVTHSTPGWTAKLFRVVQIVIRADGLLEFGLYEHQASVYDRTIPAGTPTPPDTNLPNPYVVVAPTALQAFSGTSELLKGNSGDIVTRIRLTWVAAQDIYVNHYQIEYRIDGDYFWEAATPAIGQATNEMYILGVRDSYNYIIRIRAVNGRNVKSEWVEIQHVVVGKTERPPIVTTFLVQQQPDGTRQFSWTYNNKPADHAGYLIRFKSGTGATWDEMTPLHADLLFTSPWETNLLIAGSYTFAIKAVDTTGNQSLNALYIEADLGDPRLANAIDVIDYVADRWPDTKTNCYVDENGQLVAADQGDWDDLPSTWATWNAWAIDPFETITYQAAVYDVGVVTSFNLVVSAEALGTITIEEQHSNDNVTYSSWAAVIGDLITCRYFKIKITVVNAAALARIVSCNVTLAARLVEQFIEDLDISTLTGANRIGTGHVKLPLTKTYAAIKGVSVTLQNVGAGWSVELISKTDLTNGPAIKIYNSSNTLADATIDAVIRGV